MRCTECGEDDLTGKEVAVTDGLNCLCESCARWQSNRIFNNLISIFEKEEEINRKAFAKFGIDDFACCVDEEINNE